MKKKFLLAFIMIIVVEIILIPIQASAYQESSKYWTEDYSYDSKTKLYYKVVANEVTITGVDEGVNNINIPSTINGRKVTAIGDYAFCPLSEKTTIKKVIMPDTIENIGTYAFHDCENLEYLKMSKNLKLIGWGAFSGCSSLTRVELSTGNIETYAFADCKNLKKVVFTEDVNDIQCLRDMFNNGSYSLKEIYIPNTITIYNKYMLLDGKDINDATVYISKDNPLFDSLTYYFDRNKIKYVALDIPFFDVKQNDYFYSSVKYVYENKIILGTNKNTFSPNSNITRGQLVTVLYRMEGSPKVVSKNKFKDLKNDYYYDAVIWASSKGIVSGYDDGTFGPNNKITRAQLATILWNYAKYKKIDVSKKTNITSYKDYSITQKKTGYAIEALSWAVGNKVMSGTEDGRLNSSGTATRGQASTMITNYCKNVKK